MMENKRSDGVLVLGVMATVYGIWSLLYNAGSHSAFIKNPYLSSQIYQSGEVALVWLAYLGSIVSLIIYPLFIISGFFVLKLKNWGRNLLIFISVIQLANTLFFPYIWAQIMSSSTHHAMVLPTPLTILYITNIWFFSRKRVKEQFT